MLDGLQNKCDTYIYRGYNGHIHMDKLEPFELIWRSNESTMKIKTDFDETHNAKYTISLTKRIQQMVPKRM